MEAECQIRLFVLSSDGHATELGHVTAGQSWGRNGVSEAVLDQSAATEVIESMRRERECLVATANQNLEAYRAEARKREEALEAYEQLRGTR